MSGGHFDYNQIRIKEIAREVAQIIKYNGKKDLYPKPEHYEDPWAPKYDWDNTIGIINVSLMQKESK